ncbi:LemA family protein [Bifidobacterium bombi]|uniref:LemA family protein n=1 Tax=Bifidobacterium bombi DSM 19703 TaxID=1341695 RepID=A0A086BND2_9BIFI|nr:LemA family protein [Bifidobacterium bombi]KFF30446.1 LemA family protein [Bifidobacterium bombi DSM 19703]
MMNTQDNNNTSDGSGSHTSLKITLIAVIVVVVLAATSLIGLRNGMNGKKNEVDAQWSQVENVMQRRADLIPNLVASVQGQMDHESKVFKDIADARRQYAAASTPNDKLKANDELNSKTNVLVNAVQENYPQLASSESVKTLMTQLEGSENRISVERERYIRLVNEYNNKVTSFPASMVAGLFGFSKMDLYRAQPGSENAPKVTFHE